MPKARTRRTIQDQIADFETQNPKLLEAMRLFGMTMTEYRSALHAMQAPRITTGSSTTRLDTWRNGKLGQYR